VPTRRQTGKAKAEPDENTEENTEKDGTGDTSTKSSSDRTEASDRMTAMTAARAGVEQIATLISKRPEGVTSVEPTDEGWLVQVEVLEDRHVPSSSDVLGLYDVRLDDEGGLRSYRRVKRYVRGRGSEEGA
jgi:hypothetical protein